MPYWKIASRNMLDRRLASSLTALSMALGVAAMICVLVIHAWPCGSSRRMPRGTI